MNMAEITMEKKFSCEDCHAKRMKSWDCDGSKEEQGIVNNRISILAGVPIMTVRRCPVAMIEDNVEALELWDAYITWKTLKCLPRSGGTDSQEGKIINALLYITNLVNTVEADKKFTKWRSSKHEPRLEEDKKINSFGDVKRIRKI